MMPSDAEKAVLKAVLERQATGQSLEGPSLFTGMPARLNTLNVARDMFPVEQMPPGATAIYTKSLPVVHDWREAGGARRLMRFECAGCGTVQWVRHTSKLEVPDGPSTPCRDVVVAEVHDS